MKKYSIIVLTLLFVLTIFNPAGDIFAEEITIKVGATPVPHAEILEFVKPLIAEEGIKLDIIEFTDYVTPNLALNDGSIDLNYFQHQPYLDQFNEDHGFDLLGFNKIHIEPYGLYSNKIENIGKLKEGDIIALPNDPTNEGRALMLLAEEGVIELNPEIELKATPLDILKNPKKLKFVELEAAQLPRILPDVTAAFINTNYALEAGFNPLKDSIIIEGGSSPYANLLTVKPENIDNPAIKKLAKVLRSEEVKKFILDKYEGAVVPAF